MMDAIDRSTDYFAPDEGESELREKANSTWKGLNILSIILIVSACVGLLCNSSL